VGVALAAIAYDRHLLVEDTAKVGVAIVINAHDKVSGQV
jgi:hypothetical protein